MWGGLVWFIQLSVRVIVYLEFEIEPKGQRYGLIFVVIQSCYLDSSRNSLTSYFCSYLDSGNSLTSYFEHKMISGTFNFMIVFQAEHKMLCSLNQVNCWKANSNTFLFHFNYLLPNKIIVFLICQIEFRRN